VIQTRPYVSIEPATDAESIDVETDEGLFALLLSNVFQNAIDASIDVSGRPSVQIAWGYTERNYWVRITNPFRGERFVLDDVLAVGNSSKMSHQGQGLALVHAVAQRLGIAVTLEGQSRVASFSLSGTRPRE
jgi:sensor histidine kinase regulating citrate/malate metabolism